MTDNAFAFGIGTGTLNKEDQWLEELSNTGVVVIKNIVSEEEV